MTPSELEWNVLEAGVLIQCMTAHGGGSATFRIITHRGATIADALGGMRKVVFEEMSMLRGAIYTERVLDNGWEPNQQPAPCAYLPLTWSDLRLEGRSNDRRLYLAREAKQGRMTLFVNADVPHELMFVATQTQELRVIARELAATTGADATAILGLLCAALRVQPAEFTPAAA